MRFHVLIFSLGIFILLLPFLGFPHSLDAVLTSVAGGLLLLSALGMRLQYHVVFSGILGRDRSLDAAFVENSHPPRRKRSGAVASPPRRVAVRNDPELATLSPAHDHE